MTRSLLLRTITVDPAIQPRAEMDENTVQDYAEAMRAGTEFPPIDVFWDGEYYLLADGFHRYGAALVAPLSELPAIVHEGSRRDALLFSAGANAAHGLRRTNADKRRAVERLMADPEWKLWNDSEIARRCAVAQSFAWKVRQEQPAPIYHGDTSHEPITRLVERQDGTRYLYPVRQQPEWHEPAPAAPRELTVGDLVAAGLASPGPEPDPPEARALDRLLSAASAITRYTPAIVAANAIDTKSAGWILQRLSTWLDELNTELGRATNARPVRMVRKDAP